MHHSDRKTMEKLCAHLIVPFIEVSESAGEPNISLHVSVTGGIQKTYIYQRYDFPLILHRETRKTITFKMVLAGLKSVDEKYPNSNLKSAHLRLLSIGGDDCASPPCDSPGRYGRYGYPGEDTDMDTIRGRR